MGKPTCRTLPVSGWFNCKPKAPFLPIIQVATAPEGSGVVIKSNEPAEDLGPGGPEGERMLRVCGGDGGESNPPSKRAPSRLLQA